MLTCATHVMRRHWRGGSAPQYEPHTTVTALNTSSALPQRRRHLTLQQHFPCTLLAPLARPRAFLRPAGVRRWRCAPRRRRRGASQRGPRRELRRPLSMVPHLGSISGPLRRRFKDRAGLDSLRVVSSQLVRTACVTHYRAHDAPLRHRPRISHQPRGAQTRTRLRAAKPNPNPNS